MRTKLALPLVVGLFAFFAMFGAAALAGHGTWTAHGLRLWDPTPSNYASYANIDASQAYDFGHVRWARYTTGGSLIEAEYVTCEGNEACGYRKTVTQNFPQSPYLLRSYHCARDGDHKLSGSNIFYSPCSGRGLQVHQHSLTTN